MTDLASQTLQHITPRRWLYLRGVDLAIYIFPFVVLVSAWQWLSTMGHLPANILPSPLEVARAFVDQYQQGELLRDIRDSMLRLAVGVVAGISTGVMCGVILGMNRRIADVFEPVCSFFNSLSGIAWIPLALVWFGIGPKSVTFVLWNSIYFLVLFNTLLGVRSVPLVFEHAALTLGATRWQVIRDVTLPGALPNIVMGIRMGIGFGWRALIAAEMIGATSGLGFMIYNAGVNHRTDIIVTGIVIIGTIWLATHHFLLLPFERWTIERWGLVTRSP
jgi:NitT/TauT family transport system permease protein/taurine transport system permease protein